MTRCFKHDRRKYLKMFRAHLKQGLSYTTANLSLWQREKRLGSTPSQHLQINELGKRESCVSTSWGKRLIFNISRGRSCSTGHLCFSYNINIFTAQLDQITVHTNVYYADTLFSKIKIYVFNIIIIFLLSLHFYQFQLCVVALDGCDLCT